MLLRQMRYFVSVVENNSFTEAAEQEFVSQSAISQQIHILEEELGVKLFIRQHRKFSLTPAGEYFYRECCDLLQRIERITTETQRIGNNQELSLKIGYLQIYGGKALYQAIAQFSELYPEVSIDLFSGTHEELYRELIQQTANLVLSDQRRAFSVDYHNYELVQTETLIEISTRNALSQQTKLDVNELTNTPCILLTSRDQYQQEQAYYAEILGFTGTFIAAANLEEARLLVTGNRGFLPIENLSILPDTPPTIKRIPVEKAGVPIKRKYCAFWKKSATNYYIEEFAELLKNTIHENQD